MVKYPCTKPMLAKILSRIAPGFTLVADWCSELERLIALRDLHPKTINNHQQGIDTQVLLGHSSQAMTDQYNDDRGLFGSLGKSNSCQPLHYFYSHAHKFTKVFSNTFLSIKSSTINIIFWCKMQSFS